ncbi:Uncharacterised protein [uncultured archaeon]|nr:Uncharacterised protein [uncultured archaeon]
MSLPSLRKKYFSRTQKAQLFVVFELEYLLRILMNHNIATQY